MLPEQQLLLRDETPVRIGNRALEILTALVERPGKVVSKVELFARVWPGMIVEEGNLKVNMTALRRALGEETGATEYIATVIGRGYRFVAPVQSRGAAQAARDAPAARLDNLPTLTTRVIGRAEAIEGVRQALAETRLISIVGPGGIGKTTVALAAAEAELTGPYEDGVWLVDLAPMKDAALVPNAIAAAIGLTAHSANMLAALCGYLRDRRTLILLDSCEHIIDAVAECVERLLAETPDVRLLVTSREPLRVKGERVRRLPVLDAPPAGPTDLTVETAMTYSAVQLFVERATDRVEAFELTDATAPMVAEICRRLDGLALAIELAATRVDVFSISELLDQFDDRFALSVRRRAGPERHRTLTATIDWSYDLLEAHEQTVMRRLSVCAGTFTLQEAVSIALIGRGDRTGVIEDMATLASKSLLSPEPRGAEIEYRYLDTTRGYALEKLIASGEYDETRRRHAEVFLDIAQAAGDDIGRMPSADWQNRYTHAADDIRDALAWAFSSPHDGPLAIRLTLAAIPLWEQLSLLEDCRVSVQRALDAGLAAQRSERQTLRLQLTLAEVLLHTRGPLPEVKAALTSALQIAEAQDDTDLQLECLTGLSEYDVWTGEARSVLAACDKICKLAIEKGHIAAQASADAQAGSALRYLGNLAAARKRLESMVATPVREIGPSHTARFEFDQRLMARGALGSVLWLMGYGEQAVEWVNHQRREAQASGHAVSYCAALLQTGIISLFVRDVERGGRYLDMTRAYAAEHGLGVYHAMATCTRGRWLLDMGLPFDIAAHRAALAELHDAGFRMRYAAYIANLAEGLAQHGDFHAAFMHIDDAIDQSKANGYVWGLPEVLRLKGNFFRWQGRPGYAEAAAQAYGEAMDMAQQIGALSWELRATRSLVELWREQGGNAEADDRLRQVYSRFTEGFATADLREAAALLQPSPIA